MNREKIVIYCDGACSNNQQRINRGGWGAVLRYGPKLRELSGAEADTTNNRMELTACIRALQALSRRDLPVEVHTDSAYLSNAINQRWIDRWRRNGWKTAAKQPVENRDLWEELIALLAVFREVKFLKVKGHSDVPDNERADELARQAAEELRR
jgi:ribonuclease HI